MTAHLRTIDAVPPLPTPVASIARDLVRYPSTDIPLAGQPFTGRGTGRAAVAAIFAPGPSLLFIQRSAHVGDPWSGHMAFPGGREELDDGSARAAAERETFEELGVDLARHGVWLGDLDDLGTRPRMPRKPVAVRPHVYWLDHRPTLRPNAEVADTFWFDLDRIVRGEGRGSFVRERAGAAMTLPKMDLDGKRVWGLTLRMVDELMVRLRRGSREARLSA